MVGFRISGPCIPFINTLDPDIGAGELFGNSNSVQGPLGLRPDEASYSYSISGTTGPLGSVLFSETDRVPGTWYDRTERTNMFRRNEVALGMSKYAGKEFRKSAKQIKKSLTSPAKVDVNIHFEKKDRVESIEVRGRHGTRAFRFDFDHEEAKMKDLPKDTDVMKPFMDIIAKIFKAVFELR